eukprot:scaffold585665_cov17-Prasinocladus_malaysianus.AAC.1
MAETARQNLIADGNTTPRYQVASPFLVKKSNKIRMTESLSLKTNRRRDWLDLTLLEPRRT